MASDEPRLDDTPPEAPDRLAVLGGIESLICSYLWSCDTAVRIAWCESTFGQDPWAYNEMNPHRGLFQVSKEHLGDALPVDMDLWDDATNIEAAYILWQESGWSPWACW
jgi:hypothetical protein